MRRRRALAALLVASCTVAGLACNLLNGVGDLEVDDGAETGVAGELDGNAPDASGSDARAPDPPPTCACVSAPPADWQGPFALLEGAGTPGAERACPTGLTSVLDGGADPGASSPCAPCTCSAPVGSCATAQVQMFSGNGCNNTCSTRRTIGTTCAPLTFCSPSSTAEATAIADSGTCPPDGGGPAAPSWGRVANACAFAAAPDTTCGAGQACAPKSAGAPDARTCIIHAGDVACPAGAYTARVVYAARLVDTRACSACACDPPIGTCSTGTLTVYLDNDCGNKTKDVPTSGACTSINNFGPSGSGKLVVQPQLLDGGCTPRGGQLADGGLTSADPTTLCCL